MLNGVGSSAGKLLAWIGVGILVVHTVIGVILTVQSLQTAKQSGKMYLKQNAICWARQMCIRDSFKSKHHSKNSYTTNVVNGNILVEDKRIRLPKLKWISMKKHREPAENCCLKSVTEMCIRDRYFDKK